MHWIWDATLPGRLASAAQAPGSAHPPAAAVRSSRMDYINAVNGSRGLCGEEHAEVCWLTMTPGERLSGFR